MTNWVSNNLPPFAIDDLFILKTLYRVDDGHPVSFDEWFAPKVRRMCYSGERLDQAGLSLRDNTPEEIRDVVIEMFERLEGNEHFGPGESRLFDAFDEIAEANGLRGYSRIGRQFLESHKHLLELSRLRIVSEEVA